MAEAWQDAFKTATLKTSFILALTRPMLEFLSAVADDVAWDRSTMGHTRAFPDNWIATEGALTKRGLIRRKTQEQFKQRMQSLDGNGWDRNTVYQWSACELTPAGRCVVDLIKCTGMFLEADEAIQKRGNRNEEGVDHPAAIEEHGGGPHLDWVIAGGESGHDARPMHPDWTRSLRDQCQAAGVPFLFKQWGAWWPKSQGCGDENDRNCHYGEFHGDDDFIEDCACDEGTESMVHLGKKKSGRLLDGREWNEFPVSSGKESHA